LKTNENSTENYWDERYKDKQTGWDLNQVSPPLKEFINTFTNKGLKILIPGCGNAYEAEYMLNKGFSNVTLIDIAPTLVNKLKEKFAGKSITILNEDFFTHIAKYDIILEQTFFCAIPTTMRRAYVDKCYNLLNDGGRIVGLLFNIIFEKEGPPYGGTKAEYQALFEPEFILNQFDTCKNSIPPRQGNELFIDFMKKQAE